MWEIRSYRERPYRALTLSYYATTVVSCFQRSQKRERSLGINSVASDAGGGDGPGHEKRAFEQISQTRKRLTRLTEPVLCDPAIVLIIQYFSLQPQRFLALAFLIEGVFYQTLSRPYRFPS